MWLNLVTAHLWGNALRAAAAVDRVWMFAAALVWILGLRSQVTKERKLLSWVISQVRPQKAPEAPDKPRAGTTLFWMEPAPPLQKRKVVREDAFYARRMCCRNRTAARYRTKYREGRTDLPRTPTIILEDLGVKNSSVRVFDSSGPPGYVTGDLM
ncbi:hypothetical protein PsYK624_169770 [Phanerochaete sordida]|uniref:Uncharacterized protein n=1 Tax=Phanerochaete sordida TaxID=48140 RepID=A0A9P3GU80_9APHY|nr:hypothetical protein PsYK624_169770 [Phanerochaete sordida]